MGTIPRVIEPLGPHHEIVKVGGTVHYSLEMRAYLARLPREEADRIVAELECQHRGRRIIRPRADSLLYSGR